MINYKIILRAMLFFSIFAMFAITACDSNSTSSEATEEQDNGDASNSFTYDGSTFSLGGGEVEDYGDFLDGYRNYDFYLYENNQLNSSYGIYFELFSLGESSFSSGTYSYSSTPVQGNFFEYANLIFFESDTFLEAAGGSVAVTISGNTYTLVFDLTLDDGKNLKGGITFDYQLSKIVSQELKLNR